MVSLTLRWQFLDGGDVVSLDVVSLDVELLVISWW